MSVRPGKGLILRPDSGDACRPRRQPRRHRYCWSQLRARHGWRGHLESIGTAAATIDIDNEDVAAPIITVSSQVDGGRPDPGSDT